MAIQFMDNFQSYGIYPTFMLDGLPWAVVSGYLVDDPDGVSTGKVFALDATLRIALPTVRNGVGVAQRFWLNALPLNNSYRNNFVYQMADTGGLYAYRIEPNGALSLYRLRSAAGASVDILVATTTNPVLAPRSWFHIETYVNTTTGAYEARIEGVTVLSGTDTVHPTEAIGNYSYGYSGLANSPRIKDFVLWDTSGSQNNYFVGTVTVYRCTVSADISSGWAKSTGTSDYALLDEQSPDDTDYISADSSLPAPSIMEFGNLPSTVVSVRAVQTMVRAKKSDGGDANLVVSVVSGADSADGATHAITTAAKYWYDVQELDPATATLWSPLSVNAAQIKINRTV